MNNLPEDLLNEFYYAINLRHFEECEDVLHNFQTLATRNDLFAPWCRYLHAILINERDSDWGESERIYRNLLQHKSTLEPLLHGRVLLALGINLHNQGRWQESIDVCEQSLIVFDSLNQTNDLAFVWKQIAITYEDGYAAGDLNLDDIAHAVRHCEQALEALSMIADPPAYIVRFRAVILNSLGVAHTNLQRWQAAIDCFAQFITLSHESNDSLGLSVGYSNLGEIYRQMGVEYWNQAQSAYEQALSYLKDTHNAPLHAIEIYARQGFLAQQQTDDSDALQHYDQAIAIAESLRSGISSEIARTSFFIWGSDIYINKILLLLRLGDLHQVFDTIQKARSRTLLDVLMTGSVAFERMVEASPLTAIEIQHQLNKHSMLIECFTTGLVTKQSHNQKLGRNRGYQRLSRGNILILMITHDQISTHTCDLSPEDLYPQVADNVIEQFFLEDTIRKALYTQLVPPLDNLLFDKRRVYIIPHGPLHYVPFHALIAPDGETLLREDGPEIVYAPSATILFRELQPQPEPIPGTCLAVGYNGDAGMELHFAEEEAAYIAKMAGGDALVGPTDKKAALYAQAPNYQALHFSCHGEFDPDVPLESLLHIGPGETLTGQEIMDNLRLNCNLVTLSACESGLSKVQRGDELYGLIRAFMYAGAPAILATLWRVDERSTLIFAEKFYTLVQQGTPYATALKAAQLYLKHLTRSEARTILTRHLANPAQISEQALLFQADRYLKSLSYQDELDDELDQTTLLPGESDDDKIFADPKFWAPFVLIGDPQIRHTNSPTNPPRVKTQG